MRSSILFLALSILFSTPLLAAQPVSAVTVAPYQAPQLLVRLSGGRRINLVCSGEGAPTVILTAGLSNWSVSWFLVQPGIAARTRVCSWDRAGFGFSDPRPGRLDIKRSSRDLQAALSTAGIRGPFVLVGHSMGGLETLLLADRMRDEVVGLVLVDPTIPGQYQRFARVAPNFTKYAAGGRTESAGIARACAKALRSHVGGRGLPAGCPPSIPPVFPPQVVSALTPMQADPERILTQSSMIEEMVRDTELGLNAGRNYGDIPLIVLSAPGDDDTLPPGVPSAFSFPPDVDPEVIREVPLLARELNIGHDEIARLSTRGSKRVVRGTGHSIQVFRPDLVVSAVVEVIEQSRGTR